MNNSGFYNPFRSEKPSLLGLFFSAILGLFRSFFRYSEYFLTWMVISPLMFFANVRIIQGFFVVSIEKAGLEMWLSFTISIALLYFFGAGLIDKAIKLPCCGVEYQNQIKSTRIEAIALLAVTSILLFFLEFPLHEQVLQNPAVRYDLQLFLAIYVLGFISARLVYRSFS